MGRILVIVLLIAFQISCSSGLKKSSRFYKDPSQYDVVCEDLKVERKFSHFLDVKITDRSKTSVEISGQDKKKISLSAADCLLERAWKIKERPEELANKPLLEASCKLGELNFRDSRLQKMDEDHAFYYLRKADGKVWLLPKTRCTLSEQVLFIGDE